MANVTAYEVASELDRNLSYAMGNALAKAAADGRLLVAQPRQM